MVGARASRSRFVRTFAAATAWELFWGLPSVRGEIRRCRALADAIPDPAIRADALGSLDEKQYYIYGAALFWILPDRRSPNLLRLLATYQVIANFLDYASERGAAERGQAGGDLMLALVDAVDVTSPLHDYYREHPWRDDGGFLRELVLRCRRACAELPRYDLAQPLLRREAGRAEALELFHDPDPGRRDAVLAATAARDYERSAEVTWFEQTGSATSLLAVIVLLALAAEPATTRLELDAAASVYGCWVGTLSLLLDAFFDRADDEAVGAFSAVGYYPSTAVALQRTVAVTRRSLAGAAKLPRGARHSFIVSMMVAMYLTSDNAVSASHRQDRREIRRAAGSSALLLLPVLRVWRLALHQRG
jgi:tetraprenyl-beta-curcumene synthase